MDHCSRARRRDRGAANFRVAKVTLDGRGLEPTGCRAGNDMPADEAGGTREEDLDGHPRTSILRPHDAHSCQRWHQMPDALDQPA
jgi:hypothetical protein